LHHVLIGEAKFFEDSACCRIVTNDRQKNVLGGKIFILELACDRRSRIELVCKHSADRALGGCTVCFAEPIGRFLKAFFDDMGRDADPLQDRSEDSILLTQKRQNEVFGGNLGIGAQSGEPIRFRDRRTQFDCHFVHVHITC